jgi:threonine/homoserine/homoserine lactone efflux protein
MFYIFVKSFVIGFSIAAPVGPIGMLCIKNNLTHGFKIGLATGFGAACADSFYGFLAGGGLAFIAKFLLNYSLAIKFLGGSILLYLGLTEIKNARKISDSKIKIQTKGCFKAAATTFFLTLTNPATILSFLGIFATIGVVNLSESNIALIVAGVFFGSLSWWIILSLITSSTRHKISEKFMKRIKIISGSILIGFGASVFIF